MVIIDRLSFRGKILVAPVCALALFLAFGVLCWWMLKVQETRVNVDFAGALNVLQTVQEGERMLAESHNALYRTISATRTGGVGSPPRLHRGSPSSGMPRSVSAFCATGTNVHKPVRK